MTLIVTLDTHTTHGAGKSAFSIQRDPDKIAVAPDQMAGLNRAKVVE